MTTFVIDVFFAGTGGNKTSNLSGFFKIEVRDRTMANVFVNILNGMTLHGYPAGVRFELREMMDTKEPVKP